MWIVYMITVLVVTPIQGVLHPTSPCPSVFSYEGTEPERDRWYGIVLLTTAESLVGVRLDIKLDRPSQILVSWMGEVTSEDNERYTILSLSQKLHPGPPLSSRFMVKFDSKRGIPQVRTIRLNGRQICPPDPNFPTDVQNNKGHGINKFPTTERLTKRPDPVFPPPSADWVPNRPVVVPSITEDNNSDFISTKRTTTRSGNDDLKTASSNVVCGKVEVPPAPLITNGQNTARGQWPWHIALYQIEGINLTYKCGGSLVSSTVVITAAHCVTKAPWDRPVPADVLVVYLGKYHLYQFSDDGGVQNKQVRDVHVYPEYNSSVFYGDIAVLVLTSPVEFTTYVTPVCLWDSHETQVAVIEGKEGTVVGWGYDENDEVTEELKMARMPVVTQETCLRSYPQFFNTFTSNKTFCAGFRKGTSVCNGDSGGGMVFAKDKIWYLRGLVSITVARQGLHVCDTSHYVVFVDVAKYLDWITQFIT